MANRRRSDHWTRKAKAEGLPARSVYKLEEIDRKHRIVRPGSRVLDLGCRPGSWSAYVRKRTGGRAEILGIDIHPVDGFPGTFVQMSVDDLTADDVVSHLGGRPTMVLSDMAPATMGNKSVDHLRQIALAEAALAVALRVLEPGGSFVCKVFDGSDAQAFYQSVRLHFERTLRMKPKATRKESREFFVVGLGFRPPTETEGAPD